MSQGHGQGARVDGHSLGIVLVLVAFDHHDKRTGRYCPPAFVGQMCAIDIADGGVKKEKGMQ